MTADFHVKSSYLETDTAAAQQKKNVLIRTKHHLPSKIKKKLYMYHTHDVIKKTNPSHYPPPNKKLAKKTQPQQKIHFSKMC